MTPAAAINFSAKATLNAGGKWLAALTNCSTIKYQTFPPTGISPQELSSDTQSQLALPNVNKFFGHSFSPRFRQNPSVRKTATL